MFFMKVNVIYFVIVCSHSVIHPWSMSNWIYMHTLIQHIIIHSRDPLDTSRPYYKRRVVTVTNHTDNHNLCRLLVDPYESLYNSRYPKLRICPMFVWNEQVFLLWKVLIIVNRSRYQLYILILLNCCFHFSIHEWMDNIWIFRHFIIPALQTVHQY